MLKKLQNDKGITLVELLATLVIISIIGALSYSILFHGYSNYQRIQAETQLRDEADLIMSSFIKDMFVLKGNEIISLETSCTNGLSTSLINVQRVNPDNPEEVVEGYQTGFKDGKVIVKDQPVEFYNNTVILQKEICGETHFNLITEEKENKEYKINFTLQTMKGKNPHTMEFENTVQVINDEEGDS